jgi:hypothetical protein
MTFIKLAYYDLKNGFLQEYKKFLLVPAAFSVFCFTLYFSHVRRMGTGTVGSLGDFLLYIFGGMKEYIPSKTEAFRFPAIWILLLLFLAYITLYYPYNDLMGYGQNVLVRSAGRRRWWLSKCVWNMLSVAAFFVLGWLTVFLFCLLSGMPLSLEISKYMYDSIFVLNSETALYPKLITGALLGLPLLSMVSISLLQMLLSLWIKPIYSFGVTAVILLSSAYYLQPFMIANYAMPIRNAAVVANGVHLHTGTAVMALLGIAASVSGGLAFKQYDIINKED